MRPAPPDEPADSSGHGPVQPGMGMKARGLLWLAIVGSWLLLVHNYALPLLPYRTVPLAAEDIRPFAETGDSRYPHVYFAPFKGSAAHTADIGRNQAVLLEDGVPFEAPVREGQWVLLGRGGLWMHQPGVLLFSVKDRSDPRSNGRRYEVRYPVLHSAAVGLSAGVVFVLATAWLYLRGTRAGRQTAGAPAPERPARWQIAASAMLFLAGLYCNTGTLSPYAITLDPWRDPVTGYLFNPDHAEFAKLQDFVGGAPAEPGQESLLLRRILFPVLAWPWVKVAGFEVGGVLASLAYNLAGFLGIAFWLRRHLEQRGVRVACWLLALAPATAYWAGCPYPYTLITVLSFALLLALREIYRARNGAALGWAAAMGVGFLAYDLAPFFVPALALMLAWQRRFGLALAAPAVALLPTALWLALLRYGFDVNLTNSNTATYGQIFEAYTQAGAAAAIATRLPSLFESAAMTFFGANFLFLPALALLLVAVNGAGPRVRPDAAVGALLTAGLAVFLFNHLAPPYEGWQMRGSWIARLYQPMLPAVILLVAEWWQQLPSVAARGQRAIGLILLGATCAANGLVIFGPILGDPGGLSGRAFYAFYFHFDNTHVYRRNLERYGRYPLGFRPHEPPPTAPRQ